MNFGFVTTMKTIKEPIKKQKTEKDAYNNKQVTNPKFCNTLIARIFICR